nr:hypothetical protein [uncultured Allomuricauda sp.]
MKQKHYVSENIKIKVGAAVVIWVLVVIAIVLVLPKSHKKNVSRNNQLIVVR